MIGIDTKTEMNEAEAHLSAFWVQYTSVILIILTFILGTFVSRISVDLPKPKLDQMKAPAVPEENVGAMTFSDLFISGENRINQDTFEALVFVLKNHDLDATIFISADSIDKAPALLSDDEFALATARSVTLYRAFLAKGVPTTAIQILALPEHAIAQALLTFNHEESNEE